MSDPYAAIRPIPTREPTVTIPRAQHEALIAAVKWCKTVRKEYAIMLAGDLITEADEFIAALSGKNHQ